MDVDYIKIANIPHDIASAPDQRVMILKNKSKHHVKDYMIYIFIVKVLIFLYNASKYTSMKSKYKQLSELLMFINKHKSNFNNVNMHFKMYYMEKDVDELVSNSDEPLVYHAIFKKNDLVEHLKISNTLERLSTCTNNFLIEDIFSRNKFMVYNIKDTESLIYDYRKLKNYDTQVKKIFKILKYNIDEIRYNKTSIAASVEGVYIGNLESYNTIFITVLTLLKSILIDYEDKECLHIYLLDKVYDTILVDTCSKILNGIKKINYILIYS